MDATPALGRRSIGAARGRAKLLQRRRFLLLAALVTGLLASPAVPAPPGWELGLSLAAALSIASRPAGQGPGVDSGEDSTTGWTGGVALGILPLLALGGLAGLAIGDARLRAIDGGAITGPAGERVVARGHTTAVPRRSRGEVRVPLQTAAGRVLAVVSEPVGELPIGREVRLRGELVEPEPWREPQLRRLGIALELRAPRIRLTGGRRGGLAGILDRARDRAEAALEGALDGREATLGRGFLLGQADRIDAATLLAFKRSGLAHLLAVSGTNVLLLSLLLAALLAVIGVPLRTRLVMILLIVAAYVPVAGAGPSIQRAGAMGAAGIVATLSGRPVARAWTALIAAAATLALNPRAAADVGWQLSFAAIAGIMLGAPPLGALLAGGRAPGDGLGPPGARPGRRRPRAGGVRRYLARGAAITIVATAATGPLFALHFEAVSIVSLPANLLALPAIAPVMWLGMLAGILGQIPGLPTAWIGLAHGPLIGYLAAIADAAPSWSLAPAALPGASGAALAFVALLAGGYVILRSLERRVGLRAPPWLGPPTIALLAAGLLALAPGGPRPSPGPDELRITALEVGQGDAILLEQGTGPAVLVDGGPPGGGVVDALTAAGVRRLGAVVLSHDDADHAGGLPDVFAALPVEALIRARPAPAVEAAARAAGARITVVAEGSSVRLGGLELAVLWPPREPLRASRPSGDDPNASSVVIAAGWRGYGILLTGDAEQEDTRLEPGPVDVLKVAHHGSEDAGLPGLLDRSVPRVALISAGRANPYGHPRPSTLEALAARRICTLRTDLLDPATVSVGPAGLAVAPEAAAHDPACRGLDR